MVRVKVRLERDWRPWNDSARVGEFVRQDGALVPILVQRSSEAHTNPEQLREDGRILSSLRHPNVLRTLFLSVNNAQLIFIYERFDAVSARRLLDSVARKGRRLPVRIALELTTSAARACLAASQLTDPQAGHQLTHPGPAPDNILIDHFGQVKVAGFRALNMARENLNAPSGYIPPEGSGAPGAWTYSIGVLLVELLNNEAPSPASADPNRHEATIRRAMIRTLGRAGEPVPEQVVNLIRRCLARQPEARPGLKELIADLERIITTLRPPALKTWAPSAVSAILRRYAPAFEEQSKRNHLPVKAGPSIQQDAETSAEISVVESAEKTREKTDPVPLLLPPIVPPETPSPGPPAQVQSALVARTPNTNPHNPPPDKSRSLSEPASVQPGAIAIPQDELISDEIDWRPDRKPLYVLIGSAAVIAFAAIFYAWSITPHSQTPASAPVQSPSTTEIEPSPEPPVPGLAAEPDSDPPAPEPVPEQPSPDPEPSAAVPEPEQPSPDLEPPVPVSEPSPDSEPVAEPVTASVLEPSPDPEPVTASVLEPSPGSEPVTAPVPEPVASPESEPAVTAVSDEPPDSGPFRVEFLGVDPRMERLDVRCHQGRGQGVDRVVILNAGAGPCRVTGYINGERLVVSVSLKRAQTWRCFVDGVRACR